MPRPTTLLLALATLSATALPTFAQNANPAAPIDPQNTPQTQAQPAPIERNSVNSNADNGYTTALAAGQTLTARRNILNVQPAEGIFVRVGHRSSVNAISVNPENTELRVNQGVVNISIHDAAPHAQILIDLPGGQTSLIKNGFYTFNAATNTVRVLKGEAYAYPGTDKNQKPLKVKEDHAVIFSGPQNGNQIKPFQFDPFQARADLIPYQPNGMGEPGAVAYPGYGYGPYGLAYVDGPYDYYGYGPYDYYGYYPFGFGFYGGGFYGGGFRGGWGHGGGWGGGHGGGRR